MLYNLGNILSPKARQAEKTDTRQAIRRQEPDERRRKSGEREEEQELFSTEDGTILSIPALRAFLEDFLKSLPEEKTEEQAARDKQEALHKDALKVGHDFNKKRPQTGDMAHAMGAYQSAAKSGREDASFSKGNTAQTAENLGLHASEVRSIHTLLEDLKILSKQGIEDLTIERSTSFLQSLINAVEKLKSQN